MRPPPCTCVQVLTLPQVSQQQSWLQQNVLQQRGLQQLQLMSSLQQRRPLLSRSLAGLVTVLPPPHTPLTTVSDGLPACVSTCVAQCALVMTSSQVFVHCIPCLLCLLPPSNLL